MKGRWFVVILFFVLLLVGCNEAATDQTATAPPTPQATSTVEQGIVPAVEQSPIALSPTASATAGVATETAAPTIEQPTATATMEAPLSSEWGTRAPLLEPNSEIAVAELDGRIYVIGGYPAGRITVATVQVYDAAGDSWSMAPPLPVPLNHAMAAATGERLYVIGGQSSASGGGPFLDTVFEFDPAANMWTARPDADGTVGRGGGGD